MAKEAAAKGKAKAKAEPKATANGATAKPGKEKAGKKAEPEPTGMLAVLRKRRRRVIFFFIWVITCVGIMVLHNPCDIPEGEREDCGFSGITPSQCRFTGCFMKGSTGATQRKVLSIERQKDQALGLKLVPDKVPGFFVVAEIGNGAVEDHNAALNSTAPERVNVGDIVTKVDGSVKEMITKANNAKGMKTVKVVLERPKLPSWLMWIRREDKKVGIVEKVLTAPGTKEFSRSFSSIGGVGLVLWALSGYSVASLPVYYGGLAAFTAGFSMRCCHNDKAGHNVPHCYKPSARKFQDVLASAQGNLKSFAAKVAKDPKGFFKKVFL